MDTIEIKNLRLQTRIGFSAHEEDQRQDVLINLRFATAGRRANETDEPNDAFNYKSVNKAVIRLVEQARFRLLEKLAEEIAKLIVLDFGASHARVAIEKPGALRHADSVGIVIERMPADYEIRGKTRHRAAPHIAKNIVFLSLGSNIAPQENIVAAIQLLRRNANVLAVSPAFRTAPQGDKHQPAFINLAVKLLTQRHPLAFKTQVIDHIETSLRRVRDPKNRNAPRTIDIDISLWNDEVFAFGGRPWLVPDPDIARFAHVAIPLAHVAADLRHPTLAQTLAQIAAGFHSADVQRIELDIEPWKKWKSE